jgi:Uma2 family endonuclease
MTQATTLPPHSLPAAPAPQDELDEVVNGQRVVGPAVLPPDDDTLYEVVNGCRVEKPPMSTYATRSAFVIAKKLDDFAEAHQAGRAGTEYLFRLAAVPNLQRRPDAAFVSFQRWPADQPLPHTDPWNVVPELAAEVISPSNRAEEVLDRVAEYFQAGVQLVWMIYPRQQQVYVYESPTQVHIRTRSDELDGGQVLPGFRLALATVFGPAPQPMAPG